MAGEGEWSRQDTEDEERAQADGGFGKLGAMSSHSSQPIKLGCLSD